MTKREVMQMSLDALLFIPEEYRMPQQAISIRVIEAELAKPEPEPVGYFIDYGREQWVEHDLKQLADDDKDCLTAIPLYRKEDL